VRLTKGVVVGLVAIAAVGALAYRGLTTKDLEFARREVYGYAATKAAVPQDWKSNTFRELYGLGSVSS
jgi:hypothetical protein